MLTSPTTGPDRYLYETDGSFDGLLTAIFRAYADARFPDAVVPAGNRQVGLFDDWKTIRTDVPTADRVWRGLKTHLGHRLRQRIFHAYLSGHLGMETLILQRVADAIPPRRPPASAMGLTACVRIDQLSRKVRREAHRMKGFVRFRQTDDGRYLTETIDRREGT
jgi:probable DNA metabolism protein